MRFAVVGPARPPRGVVAVDCGERPVAAEPMNEATGRKLVMRTSLAALALTLAGVAAAQQPGLSVGTSAALGYRQYADVPGQCCPLWTWVEFGAGRIHIDYLYSYRESEGYGGYPLDGDNGNAVRAGFDGPIEHASLQWHSLRVVRRHETSVMWVWRPLRRPHYTLSVLAGGIFATSDVNDCQAREGPVEQVVPTPREYSYDPDHVVYEWRLTEGDRRRCREKTVGWFSGRAQFSPNAGVVLDVPIGEKMYFRAGYRMLFTAVVGFGVGF